MLKSLQATAAAMQLCATLMTDFATMSSSVAVPASVPAASGAAAAESNGKRKRKEKVQRDPLKPKRPMSAYLLYQSDLRKKLLDANPGMPNSAIMGMVAEKWRALTDEEKKVSLRKNMPLGRNQADFDSVISPTTTSTRGSTLIGKLPRTRTTMCVTASPMPPWF
jgi:hypothetical protein